MPARLVVLASGRGSNMEALVRACRDGRLDAEVVGVASNRRRAGALKRAEAWGLSTLHAPFAPFRGLRAPREAYDRALGDHVTGWRPDLVVLAGWMRILSPAFLDRFPDRVLNLHPALPGAFPGRRAIERTFEAFRRGEVDRGGVMVHRATAEVDAGAALAVAEVPIQPADTLERFEARVHAVEHETLLEGVRRALDETGTASTSPAEGAPR